LREVVEVDGLCKFYEVHHKEPGFLGSLKSLYRRRYRIVRAVDGISFSIEPGEIVGFLGPNGAGKTTTLKVLAGLLYPTSGRVTVLGYTPYERHPGFLKSITLVMGQKNQLIWDLPPIETFLLNKTIYDIDDITFRERLNSLSKLLDLDPLLKKQVRKLSLGERMKCELAAAFLNMPSVLYIDELTIRLDVHMQQNMHAFIKEYNRLYGATVLLSSHYMQDVMALCQRILIINNGKMLYDGSLKRLVENIAPYKILKITLEDSGSHDSLARFGEVESLNGQKAVIRVPRKEATAVAAAVLNQLKIRDIVLEEPSIEEIIAQVFSGRIPS